MKKTSQLAALCTLPLLSGAGAFVLPTQRTSVSSELNAFSYLDSVNSRYATNSNFGAPDTIRGGPMTTSPMDRAYGSGLQSRQSLGNGAVISQDTSMAESRMTRSVWDTVAPITVQGGSLRTWSFKSPYVERVQVLMKTEGRPLFADIDLWQGPDNTPTKLKVYVEDGDLRPFSCLIETPGGYNALALRNTGPLEFPLEAVVEADVNTGGRHNPEASSMGLSQIPRQLDMQGNAQIVQGGSVKTYPFAPFVSSVQLLLKTEGRPLNARIELLQGPNNKKQTMEIYSEDGLERPFFAILETPGPGNVVRIVNTATVEYPMTAVVEPYLVEPNGGVFW